MERKKKLDTTEFKDFSAEEYKKQTQEIWTTAPCGSGYSDKEFMSKQFFDEIEDHRYSSHPWINEEIKKFNINGKKVLEIGFGMGTDHLMLARQGGIMHGVDLTFKNIVVTQKRKKLYGFKSKLIVADAEYLPFDTHSFDFVYSFGVVHHSPDTRKIISEIYRVLKPNGKCWITVYHKNSIFFWWSVTFVDWILKRGYKKETLKQRISRIEYPNDNQNLVIRLYKKREFEELFYQFKQLNSSIHHLIKDDVAFLGQFIPNSILKIIGKKLGWYVLVKAKK